MKTQRISLPNGFTKSINERSTLNAVISNLNQATKYVKYWHVAFKKSPTPANKSCLDQSISWGLKYKDEFLSAQHLADLYHALWGEKYYKAKHLYEKQVEASEKLLK